MLKFIISVMQKTWKMSLFCLSLMIVFVTNYTLSGSSNEQMIDVSNNYSEEIPVIKDANTLTVNTIHKVK